MADKYYVAKNKAITTKKGVLGQGELVEVKDFVGGQKSIDMLIEKGLLIVEKPDLRIDAEIIAEKKKEKAEKSEKEIYKKK